MARYCYDFPRPSVAADIAALQYRQAAVRVLLIRRGRDPFAGQWALPGGFVDIDEPLEHAASRELQEETGLAGLAFKELGVFGRPGRDPRGRTISVAYYAIIPADREPHARHGDDASDTRWFDIHALPPLAFDHAELLQVLLARLRLNLLYFFEGIDFAGAEFTLADLHQIHQAILNRPVNRQTLQARLHDFNLLEKTGRHATGPAATPEPLYRVNRTRLDQIRREHLLAPLRLD